jgi:hypothetical protein
MSAFYPFLQVKQNGRRTGAQPDSTTPLAGITHLVNDRLAPEAVIKAGKGASGIGQRGPALPPSPSADRLKSLKNNQSSSDAPDGL